MGMFVNYCAGVSREILPAQSVEAILVNVPQNAFSNAAVRETRKMFQCADTVHTMMDSGGYQNLQVMLNGGIVDCDKSKPMICSRYRSNIAPEHIVEANMKIRPHIMTSLDLPIPKLKDSGQQYSEFIKKLGPNLVWMRETALLRQKYCPEI